MDREKLKIYNFYNGYVHRNASLCNIYQVLYALKLAPWPLVNGVPRDAMCWVRDYKEGCTIETQTQLDTVLLNDPWRLRISFFSPDIYNIKDLQSVAESAQFPDIRKGKPELPTGMDVYTLWFHDQKASITKSGITNIDTLFVDMVTAYRYYPDLESTFTEQKSPPKSLSSIIENVGKKLEKKRISPELRERTIMSKEIECFILDQSIEKRKL